MGQVGLFFNNKMYEMYPNGYKIIQIIFFTKNFGQKWGYADPLRQYSLKKPILPPDLEQKPLSGKLDVGSL